MIFRRTNPIPSKDFITREMSPPRKAGRIRRFQMAEAPTTSVFIGKGRSETMHGINRQIDFQSSLVARIPPILYPKFFRKTMRTGVPGPSAKDAA